MEINETILYAVRVGHKDWQEEIITVTTIPAHLASARNWAKANGFDRLRVAMFDGSAPDFTSALERSTQ